MELGAAFRSQYGDAGGAEFNYWAKELSNLTEQEILRGLERFKKSESSFLNLKVFRKHCMLTGEDVGIDKISQAMIKTIRGEWDKLHPAFQTVARNYDIYSMKRVSSEESLKMFKPLYNEVITRIASGEEFEPVKMISNEMPVPKRITQKDIDAGKKELEKIFKSLGTRNFKS